MIMVIMIFLCKRYLISCVSRSSLISENLTGGRDLEGLQFPTLFLGHLLGEYLGGNKFHSLGTITCLIIKHLYLKNLCSLMLISFLKKITYMRNFVGKE